MAYLVIVSCFMQPTSSSRSPILALPLCQRPYHIENTSSRPITEVKQCWARLVLGWVTAWEHRVLLASLLHPISFSKMMIENKYKCYRTGLHHYYVSNIRTKQHFCFFPPGVCLSISCSAVQPQSSQSADFSNQSATLLFYNKQF